MLSRLPEKVPENPPILECVMGRYHPLGIPSLVILQGWNIGTGRCLEKVEPLLLYPTALVVCVSQMFDHDKRDI